MEVASDDFWPQQAQPDRLMLLGLVVFGEIYFNKNASRL
jgi:hypothetical protein